MYFRIRMWTVVLAAAAVIAAGANGNAQDTRTVTEPVFPPSCAVLNAQLAIVNGEPASETTFDTTRIQNALNACASGQAVELQTSGTNAAFLIQPITLPANVTLLVDGGVTVFASRNPADYQTSSTNLCGTNTSNADGCNPLITANNSNSGLMGYGIINGRGGDKMLVNGVASTLSWWDVLASGSGGQNDFEMYSGNKANNFVFYKITFVGAPYKNILWTGTGLTVWGMKIIDPYTAPNTDGVDPKGTLITITHSAISDGDDNVAIVDGSASGQITISNDNTYSGHGISVGSPTNGGLTNMLVTNVNQSGTLADGSGIGLRLKSAQDRGGVVQNVTYQNICSQNIQTPIVINPFYDTTPGTLIPTFQNIVYRNVHILTEGHPEFQGYDVNHLSTITFDNVVFDVLQTSDLTKYPPQDVTFTLGPGPVTPTFLQNLTGPGVSYNGSVTLPTEAAYLCPATNFPDLSGELYLSAAGTTNQPSMNVLTTESFTLNAVVQTAFSQSSYTDATNDIYTGVKAPTAAVQFYEGTTLLGSGSLGVNGTLASLAINGVTAGTHTYTAKYPGDTNHPAYTFGSVTVTTVSATPTSTAVTFSPTSVYAGGPVTATVTVTSAASVPTGTVNILSGSTVLGSGTLLNGTATVPFTAPAVGSGSLTASYVSSGIYAASSATATLTIVAPFTLSATPTSLSLAAGAAGTVTVTATPVSGFTGQVSYSCTESALYISCGVFPTTGTVIMATIAVSPSVSEVHRPGGFHWNAAGYLALLLPLGLLGFRRRGLSVLSMMVILMALGMVSGCTSGAAAGKAVLPPAGTQSATIIASTTLSGVTSTQSTVITVNVTN